MTSLPDDIFLSVLSSVEEAVLITDTEMDESGPRILFVNRAFEKMTGYRLEEIRNSSTRFLQGPETERSINEQVKKVLERGSTFTEQTTNYRKDGTSLFIERSILPYPDQTHKPKYFIVIQKDITQKLKENQRLERLELIQHVRQEITSEGLNLDSVRQRVADVAMEISGAEAAVVEEPDGEEMVYRAVSGTAQGQLGLRLGIDQSLSGFCYRKKETVNCKDSQVDDRIFLKAKALEIGFRSAILVPLLHQGKCYGVLKVYSSCSNNFSIDDQRLIELSSDILTSSLFDAATFDEEVSKRQILLDTVPISIAYIDPYHRYVEVNAVHEKLFELPISEIRGSHLASILKQDDYNRIRPYIDGALAGESVNFEIELNIKAGEEHTYRGNLEPHYDSRGNVEGCYLVMQDITDIKLAEKDYLTGLLNRRKFEELAVFLMQARNRKGNPLSFIMLDIDKFKRVNDNYGHASGDEVLKSIGRLLLQSVRQTDVLCRWGGEEFAILLNESNLKSSQVFAERLLDSIRTHKFGPMGKITASIGIAEAETEDDLKSLQEKADFALYRAKAEGRDRAVAAPS